MPLYASYGVACLWLVDPMRRTLEACALDDGEWQQIARAHADRVVSVPPFEALRLEWASLPAWGKWWFGCAAWAMSPRRMR